VYCVKSADSVYVAVNHAFAERVGRADRGEVIGRRAAQLFPPDQAARYEAQDRTILRTGRGLHDVLELITDRSGESGWFLTNKEAIRSDEGKIVGLVAMSVNLHRRERDRTDLDALAAVSELSHQHLTRTVEVGELARAAGMTVGQLERRMRRTFGLSPRHYLVRVRIDEAARLLTETDEPLAVIAHNCGWYDQSAFTRQFRRVTGRTPGTYRTESSATKA
jgi:PAS domain S-box-containing protein